MSVESVLQDIYKDKQRLFKILLNLLKMSKVEIKETNDEELFIIVGKGHRQSAVEVLNKLGYKSDGSDVNNEYFIKGGYGGIYVENGMGEWIVTIKYSQKQLGDENVGTKVFLSFLKSIADLDSEDKKILYKAHTSDSPVVSKQEYDTTYEYISSYWNRIDDNHYEYNGLYVSFFPSRRAVVYTNQPETTFTDYDDDRI